jgi:hypothetical protein
MIVVQFPRKQILKVVAIVIICVALVIRQTRTAGTGTHLGDLLSNNVVEYQKVVDSPLTPNFDNDHPVCQQLVKSSSPSFPLAGALWTNHLDSILQASQHPLDTNYTMKEYTHNLLLDLSPSLLQRSLLSRPRPKHVERILNTVEKRRRYPDTAPPLKILVLGGSVTEGVGCEQSGKIKGRSCNWSVRLESFVNSMLGFDAIKVYNIASGGTSTMQAVSLVKYWMYPDAMKGPPDVIIHAYGANDSNLGNVKRTELERVQGLFIHVLKALNAFTQQVYKAHPCPLPIVFHLDDYVGTHSQGGVLGDNTYRMVLRQVAGWYQNFAVSSAHALEPLIYPDTLGDQVFSPKWQIGKKGSSPSYGENCHFGWPGHQAIVWSWAYSFVDVVINFCDAQDWERKYQTIEAGMTDRKSLVTSAAKELSQVAPPPLDDSLRLEDVSLKWTEEAENQRAHCKETVNTTSPCSMAWIAGPVGRTSNPSSLGRYIKPFLTTNDGWGIQNDMSTGWSRKLGLVATKLNAVAQFDFPSMRQTAKILTIQSLKSYGDKWEGSQVQVLADVQTANSADWTRVLEEHIQGSHNSTSSIDYTAEFELGDSAVVGSNVRVQIILVGGTAFKITGMMLCSR